MQLRERIIRRIVRLGSMYIEEQVSRAEILDLIAKLHPIDSGHALIRVGPDSDGGYLLPDDLSGIEYCFSPGVANISGFEEELVSRGIVCFLADYAVEAPQLDQDKYVFDKKYIGSCSNDIYMTLDEWKNKYLPGYRRDLILQMDVEGNEYEILFNISDNLLQQFRILVIEFHFLPAWFDKNYFAIVRRVFDKVLQYFDVVHLHPNNYGGVEVRDGVEVPRLMEFTLLRKDRFKQRIASVSFPHKLDVDNVLKPSVVLTKCWFRSES